MKLTKKSELLMSFLLDNKCIEPTKQSNKTKQIFTHFYKEIRDAEKYIEHMKRQMGKQFYNLQISEIDTFSQIPKPTTFPADGFPPEVRKHIDENITYQLSYFIPLLDRKIKIHFLLEDMKDTKKINNMNDLISVYNNYVDTMLIWLTIINEYASKTCASELTVYLYFTSLEKNTPSTNIEILSENHINTAFTMTCPKISEIVIFRKEEWFKVFLHETFHNWGLDFSDMNNEICNKQILSIFPVKSEINLFESYAEFWAKIMNALFCSYVSLSNKEDINEFLEYTDIFIYFEQIYSYFQMVKVLDFMNLKYEYLYSKDTKIESIRNTLYRENTNVLSYYIITLILLNNYQAFIQWCHKNNIVLLQFKKTVSNQTKFCDFIIQKYKSAHMLENIKCTEALLGNVKTNLKKTKYSKQANFLLKNLRMTVCELG
jgi:hypothetical protein